MRLFLLYDKTFLHISTNVIDAYIYTKSLCNQNVSTKNVRLVKSTLQATLYSAGR